MLSGKIEGSANLVLQKGSVKNLVVNGRVGGIRFFECDLRKATASFTGDIEKLVKNEILRGTYLREKSNLVTSKFISVVENLDNSEINAIKIPENVKHYINLNIAENTKIRLKNRTNKYINARGTYFCRLRLNTRVISIPPPVCTFKLEWTKHTTDKTETVLDIKKSTYDYMDNLSKSEEVDMKNLNSEFDLPTLDVSDTTDSFRYIQKTDELCENRKGRYDIVEISSANLKENAQMLEV